MNDLNYVLVTGTLTRNPEQRLITADTNMCRFTIAINRFYKKKGKDEFTSDPSYFFVETWGELADNCIKYLTKGRKVRITGHLKQVRWDENSNHERPRERTYIIAEHVEFGSVPHKKGESAPQNSESEEVQKTLDAEAKATPEINETDTQVAESAFKDENTEESKDRF